KTCSSPPVNARSVPCSGSTRYCSGESSARHSASVLTTLFGKRSPFLVFACTDRFNVDSLPRSPCHRRGTWRGVMLEAVLHHRLLHGAHLVEPPNGSVVGRGADRLRLLRRLADDLAQRVAEGVQRLLRLGLRGLDHQCLRDDEREV